MNYAPNVSDNRGEILARGGENRARFIAQGYDALADGINSASKSIAGGIQDYGAKSAEAKKLTGVGEYYFKENPQKLDAFHAGDLATKQGMIAGYLAEKSDVESGGDRAMRDWQHVDASTRQWYTATKPDETFTNNGQLTPMKDEQGQVRAYYAPQSNRGGTILPAQSAAAGGNVAQDVVDASGQVIGKTLNGKFLRGSSVKALTPDQIAEGKTTDLGAVNKQIDYLGTKVGANPSIALMPSGTGLPGETYAQELERLRKAKTLAERVQGGQFSSTAPPQATGVNPQGAPLAQGNPVTVTVTVKSKAERDQLPAGTRYVGPDGISRIKQ